MTGSGSWCTGTDLPFRIVNRGILSELSVVVCQLLNCQWSVVRRQSSFVWLFSFFSCLFGFCVWWQIGKLNWNHVLEQFLTTHTYTQRIWDWYGQNCFSIHLTSIQFNSILLYSAQKSIGMKGKKNDPFVIVFPQFVHYGIVRTRENHWSMNRNTPFNAFNSTPVEWGWMEIPITASNWSNNSRARQAGRQARRQASRLAG